jgi:threonyl-tRNA synthetase
VVHEKDLEEHLHRIEEAKRRDHRRLGRELDLFIMHPCAGRRVLDGPRHDDLPELGDWMRTCCPRNGYQHVKTPLLFNKGLWELSGHWGKYRENMFLVLDNETGEHDFSLKPMNCPSHHLMYAAKKHSYRELPIRYATQDVLHRNEVSGALSGLTRVRQFQQDDAHIYLARTRSWRGARLVALLDYFYDTLGLRYRPKFATRPEQRIGDDAMWDRAEAALRNALEATELDYELKEGDGAFYGPKIDFDVRTPSAGPGSSARSSSTTPRPSASTSSTSARTTRPPAGRHPPRDLRLVRALHRDPDRALRRRLPALARAGAGAGAAHHRRAGATPLPSVRELRAGASAPARRPDETLNYKIREAETQKVPYMAVIGAREAEAGTVAVRQRGAGGSRRCVALGGVHRTAPPRGRRRSSCPCAA